MRLRKKPSRLVASENHWADDMLNVQSLSSELVPIIGTIEQPTVIGVSAPYGSGKSFFAERFKVDLEATGHPTILVNVWRDDHLGDPLPHLVSSISEGIQNSSLIEKNNKKKIFENGAKLVACRAIPTLLNHGIRYLTGIDGEEIGKAFGEGVGDASEQLAEEVLSGFKKQKNSVDNFKNSLRDLIETPNAKNQKVIIVDELDRCDPVYVIRFLEVLKHIFDVDGFVFVLMCDIDYLRGCIKTNYSGIDDDQQIDSYLRKFIDWNARLPLPNCESYARYLIEEFDLTPIIGHPDDWLTGEAGFIEPIAAFAKVNKLTLRDLDRVFTSINFLVRGARARGEEIFAPAISYMSLIKEMRQSEYLSYLDEENIDRSKTYPNEEDVFNNLRVIRELITVANFKQFDQIVDGFLTMMRHDGFTPLPPDQAKRVEQADLWFGRSEAFSAALGFNRQHFNPKVLLVPVCKQIGHRLEMYSRAD